MRSNKLFMQTIAAFLTSFTCQLSTATVPDQKDHSNRSVKPEVVLVDGILSDDIPPAPDKKTRYALLAHYADGSYFLPDYEQNDEASRVLSPAERAITEVKAREKIRSRVVARRKNVVEKAGIDQSQFLKASLYIALTERYLPQLDLYTLIYDIAFFNKYEAAKALETIDRNLERIATRILATYCFDCKIELNIRRSYGVSQKMTDIELVELLKRYRKAGYVPKLDRDEIRPRVFKFMKSVRYVIIAVASMSQNEQLIPLLSRYAFEGGTMHLATTAQRALETMVANDDLTEHLVP